MTEPYSLQNQRGECLHALSVRVNETTRRCVDNGDGKRACGFQFADTPEWRQERRDARRGLPKIDEEIWFEVEYSKMGEDDWYSADTKADSIQQINRKMAELEREGLEFRVIKKTLTSEVFWGNS